jgi:hypothetical protein
VGRQRRLYVMNRPPTLSKYVEKYTKLWAWWEKARSAITMAAKTSAGVELYQVVPADIIDEVRLRVCGALAYVRFRHDLENGRLEYGVLLTSADGRSVKYRRVKNVDFDERGNVGEHYHFDEVEEQSFKRLHLQTVTETVPTIVELYFSETQNEATR